MANKTELINEVQSVLEGLEVKVNKKESATFIEAVLQSIINTTAEHGKLQLIGFGNFEVRERDARKGRNPQTQEEIDIEAKKSPAFKAGKGFKDAIK